MAKPEKRKTIKDVVFSYVRETNGDVDYDELTRRVREVSPHSAWNKKHWLQYRSHIANGRYSSEFPDDIRMKCARRRPLRAKSEHSKPTAHAKRETEGNVKAESSRRREKRAPVYPNLMDDEVQRALALALARVAHHVHPAVVAKIQRLNVEHGDELRAMLPPQIRVDDYLYPGSACVFPGVRRWKGTFDQKQKRERNKYSPENGAIIDQNIFPRHLWTFLTRGCAYSASDWKKGSLDQFELAHIFSHKPGYRHLEGEVFQRFDPSVQPWGLFTCASNTVLLPKGSAKPTDGLPRLRIVFFKRAIDLYGEGVLPGASGFRDDRLPLWYSDLVWNEPILPEDWEDNIESLHIDRIRRLSGSFGKPV